MKDIEGLFFELIRVAIGTQEALSRVPTAKEWKMLYAMAKKQSLVGVCFAALQRLGADADEGFARIGMSETLYLTWMGMAVKIQMRNEKMNGQCVELQRILAENGFRSCILKGQGVASLYSKHLRGLRQSGDIDVLVDAPRADAIAYVKKHCPKVSSLMSHHIDFPIWNDTMIEMHYLPAQLCNPFKQKKLLEWYKSKKADIFNNRLRLINGDEIVAPDTEFNLVYVLLHIYKHLFAEGIGLRQLMDYYFVLQTSCDNTNVFRVVHNLGLDKFASALMWVLGHVFGLQKEYLLWKPDKNEGRWLLEDIMRNGNMGHGREDWIKHDDSAWFRFRKMTFANLRLLWHYPSETIWFPYFKLWHYPWRKWMERKLR